MPVLLRTVLLLLRGGERGQRPVLWRAVAWFEQHQQGHVVFKVVVAVAHLTHHSRAQQGVTPEGGTAVTPAAITLQVYP